MGVNDLLTIAEYHQKKKKKNTLPAHPMSQLDGQLPTLPHRFPRHCGELFSVSFSGKNVILKISGKGAHLHRSKFCMQCCVYALGNVHNLMLNK